jgi:hypothetical protein
MLNHFAITSILIEKLYLSFESYKLKKEDEGFYYLKNIGISIQGVDSNKCLSEIISQCIENKIKLSMKIKLIDNVNINILF